MTDALSANKEVHIGPLLFYLDDEDSARLMSLTDASKSEARARYDRLLGEGWPPEIAALMCSGRLPDDKRKWPPTPRYKLGNGGEDKEEEVRRWMLEWFYRNHEVQQ